MAEVTRKDVEFLFQEEALTEHGKYVMDLFHETISRKKLIKDDVLYTTMKYEIEKKGVNFILNFFFENYGRYIEIRKHKKRNFFVDSNKLLWGKEHKKKKPKDTDWYSKNAYGSLNRLISIIMYELIDSEFDRLKAILETR